MHVLQKRSDCLDDSFRSCPPTMHCCRRSKLVATDDVAAMTLHLAITRRTTTTTRSDTADADLGTGSNSRDRSRSYRRPASPDNTGDDVEIHCCSAARGWGIQNGAYLSVPLGLGLKKNRPSTKQ